MKAVGILTDSPNTTTSTVSNGGRVSKARHHHGNRDIENEEVQMYLSKLRDLVPFMPRGRKLSKLEVIQNVIDYICDLQSALEAHPAAVVAVGAFDAAAVLSRGSNVLNGPGTTRQPLGVRSSTPNTILAGSTNAPQAQMIDYSTTSTSSSLSSNISTHSQFSDKQPSSSSPPPDDRSLPSSC